MLVRLKSSLTNGQIAGPLAILYTIMEAIVLFIVELLFPANEIDILPSFNTGTTI